MSPIDEHLQRFEGEQLATLQALRDTIRAVVPDAEERISYRMPAFVVDGKVVAGFEGFKHHCSYFPHSGGVIEHAGPFPSWCEPDGGTLRFPIGKRLPVALVRRLIRVRMDEIAATAAARRRR